MCIGPLFHADDVDALRPRWAVDAEALRRAAASATPLLTERALPNAFGWMTNVATGGHVGPAVTTWFTVYNLYTFIFP